MADCQTVHWRGSGRASCRFYSQPSSPSPSLQDRPSRSIWMKPFSKVLAAMWSKRMRCFARRSRSAFRFEGNTALMERLARANAHAVRGLGVDYASNPKMFVFGVSAGPAVNDSGFDLFERGEDLLPANGFTPQAGIMAGVNLGAFNADDDSLLDRFVVYTNAMRAAPEIGDYQATVWTWGLHGQYAIVPPVKSGAVTWGGVDATTGFDLASYTVALTKSTPIDGGLGTWDATGTYEVKAKATTIPLEISTSGLRQGPASGSDLLPTLPPARGPSAKCRSMARSHQTTTPT